MRQNVQLRQHHHRNRVPLPGIFRSIILWNPSFVLTCDYQKKNITNINITSMNYRVLEIEQTTQTMTISREDVMEEACPTEMKNTTLDYSTFDFATDYTNITFLYGCPPGGNFKDSVPVSCGNNNGDDAFVLPGIYGPGKCNHSVVVPFPLPGNGETRLPNGTGLVQILRQGFEIKWKIDSKNCSDCTLSEGRCGYDFAKNQTTCYCPVPPYASYTCDTRVPFVKSSPRWISPATKTPAVSLGLGVVLGVIGSTILAIIAVLCYVRTRRSPGISNKGSNKYIEKFLFQNGSLSLKRYKYSEIKKITKSFSEMLGKGGYGSVYKGVLPDGSFVAVKVLIKTDSNGEEFINEVASISKTSHVNIVNLLGFCHGRNKKRALVYEFMPNKSLDKFINNNNCLDLDKLYEIAVGVAKGLQYLHTGCNTKIVHFDIKPQNILLDEDLCPKISDFGLAKLCKKKQSVVSLFGTCGTIGYIAPEIFSRNFGTASDKSDVYSYGMMILEMAGARKFDEIEKTGKSSENYFPDKIYEHVILDATVKLNDVVIEADEKETTRKMFLIGFWCIQTSPSDRPSMSKVVEMLEGSLQSIQIPPKPFLFSPRLSGNGISSSLSSYVGLEHSVDGPIYIDI